MAESSEQGPFVRALLPRPLTAQIHGGSESTDLSQQLRPRLVLLEHSLSLPSRLTASCPEGAEAGQSRRMRTKVGRSTKGSGWGTGNHDAELYRLAGLRTPSQSAARDLAGFGMVLSALQMLVDRSSGRGVRVKVADAIDLRAGEIRHQPWVRSLHERGAVVDLASDPLGWDGGKDDSISLKEEEKASSGPRLFPSRLDDLQGAHDAIQAAAASISAEGTTGSIPVLFDSITPLISFHGSENSMKFLRLLLARDGTKRSGLRGVNVVLSPVIIPLLVDTMCQLDSRRLEDEADAMVEMSGGTMKTIRRGGGNGKVGGVAGRLVNGLQDFYLEPSDDGTRLLLYGSTSPQKGAETEVRKESREEHQKRSPAINTAKEERASIRSSLRDRVGPRVRPMLQHEEGERAKSDAASAPSQSTSGPRIYIQDDDPEYDDMDEEDLDDDLDL